MVDDGKVEIRNVDGKEFIVHKVDPMKETLFQVSWQYKVSKRTIMEVNKFQGEDIFFMKELLIPYTGQKIALKDPQDAAKDAADNYQKVQVGLMSKVMISLENSFNTNLAKIIPSLKKKNEESKRGQAKRLNENATFYLEQNNGNYQEALQQYKLDLRG